MRDEDIEILEDLPENNEEKHFEQTPNINQNYAPSVPQSNQEISNSTNYQTESNEVSSNDFDKLISEPINFEEKPDTSLPQNNNDVQSQPQNQINDTYGQGTNFEQSNDANNDLVQSNGDQDLTITAVYPNGFVVPDQEEAEENVVQPAKKKSNDLYLIIIVAVLAITLVVMLVIFYL